MSFGTRNFPHASERGFGFFLLGTVALVLAGCASGPPAGVDPVTSFDPERYLGTWYEIARYDHGFERELTHVSATYTEKPDGSIEVANRGYHTGRQAWQDITGSARLSGDPETGSLLVTFFPPFESGYHVFDLDRRNYQWALVAGANRNYLWILSRTPEISPSLRRSLEDKVVAAGYDPEKLIEVDQANPPPES